MILRPLPEGLLLIPQSAHALAAFALARHWGNRLAPRPSPLNEVLAAVLLHDGGWDVDQREPALTPTRQLASFHLWPQGQEREKLWWDGFRLAEKRGRYVAWLVGQHLLHLAHTYSPGAHEAFLQAMGQELAVLEQSLRQDPTFAPILRTGQDQVNRAILRVCDALALHLCLGQGQTWTLPAAPFKEGPNDLHLEPAGEGAFRLHPWPFQGLRLALSVEGRLLRPPLPESPEDLAQQFQQAPWRRLTFRLLRLGTPL